MRVAAEPTLSAVFESPVGPLLATVTPAGLTRLEFIDGVPRDDRPANRQEVGEAAPRPTGAAGDLGGLLDRARDELAAYFAGVLRSFSIPVEPPGSAFCRSVWAELARIPYGSVVSYAEVARRIGRPAAVRAVGRANGANPIAIIVPCHRVIASDRSLCGYGGGLARKQWLLDLEHGASCPPLIVAGSIERALGRSPVVA